MTKFESANDFFHPAELQALSQVQGDVWPVFSLYLNMTSGNASAGDLLERYNVLLREAEQQKKLDQTPEPYKQQWAKDVETIRDWLRHIQPNRGQGLALFSAQAANLWRVFRLPVPVADQLVVKDQPHIRPLQILSSEYGCTLVVLITPGMARFVSVQMAQAEELDLIEAVPVTGDSFEEYSGVRHFARSVIERAETLMETHGCQRLVIGSRDESVNDLRDELPSHLSERLAGEVHLSPLDEFDQVLADVREIETRAEQELEARRVDELIQGAERNQGEAVLGVEQSLLSVRSKNKVRLLVVEEDFHLPGAECPNCGFLTEELEHENCMLCGVALRQESDIIEVALARVIDQGGQVEVLRSQPLRNALKNHGRMGALLNDLQMPPPTKNSANRRIIAKDGEINSDALHDEAMEESFPASDPPSWSS